MRNIFGLSFRFLFKTKKRGSLTVLYTKKGVGLVITLSVVVLITILILAFFTRARINRQIAFSSTNQIKAGMLADSALDLIIGQLRQQIADGSSAIMQNDVTIYLPKDATCLLPKTQSGLGAGSILYVSGTGSTLDPYATSPLQFGSTVAIDTASRNGRKNTHWFTDGPQLGTASTPMWTFLTQGAGVSASPNTAAASRDPNCVIGRFAYTIYDLSGLLNANVVGYPSVMNSDPNHYSAFKSSQAYADLTRIGLHATEIDNLVSWRNPNASTSASGYNSYLNAYGQKFGFLQTKVGNNVFFSRKDMLNAAANGIAGLSLTAPNYLTTFSRSVNSPSWSPITPSGSTMNYAAQAESTTSTNRDIPNVRFTFNDAAIHSMTQYRDDGTSFTYQVRAGVPLIQYRFSLAKLVWLTPKGPSGDLPVSDPFYNAGGTDAAIQACFGLRWIGGSTEHWEYVGVSGGALQTSIKTLDQIATDIKGGRTTGPNFFELLKAGILNGSLGTASQIPTMAGPNQMVLEQNKDVHILKIGANIINCASNTNYPIIIAFVASDLEIAGSVDLPYFYSLQSYLPRTTGSATGASTSSSTMPDYLTNCDLCWTPIFFNPNRSISSFSVPTDSAHTPQAIQISFASNSILNKLSSSTAASPFLTATPTGGKDLSGLTPITMPQSQYESFRAFPTYLTGAAGDPDVFGTLVPYATSNKTVKTFLVYSYEHEEPGTNTGWCKYNTLTVSGTNVALDSLGLQTKFQNVLLRMRYQTPNGNWKTYTTLAGQENSSSSTGFNSTAYTATGSVDSNNGPVQVGPNFNSNSQNVTVLGISGAYSPGYMFNNFDPRTNRLGPCGSLSASQIPALSTLVPPPGVTKPLQNGMSQFEPYDTTDYPARHASNLNKTFWGLWPQGGKGYNQLGPAAAPSSYSAANSIMPVFNYPDPDGVFRPADGWLESAIDATNTTNLYAPSNIGNTNSPSRPVLLHRPYRSVGELGYVFRDNAWKTLNFFDTTSGDSALLDLFCVSDQPAVTADSVNLNTQQREIQAALFSGSPLEPDGSSTLTSSVAESLASAYNSYAFNSGSSTSTMPANAAQLACFMSDSSSSLSASGLDNIKYHREVVIRSLADTTQTRTWNLLIDVVAQTGRYPANGATATEPAAFIVEGEKRCWLSVAIDRFTGKVIDRQLEVINE